MPMCSVSVRESLPSSSVPYIPKLGSYPLLSQVPVGPFLYLRHNTSSSFRHLGPLQFCNLTSISARPSKLASYKTYVQFLVVFCRIGPLYSSQWHSISTHSYDIFSVFFFQILLFVFRLNNNQMGPCSNLYYSQFD